VSSGNSIEETIDKSVKANINASVDKLRQNSEILQKLIDKEGLRIVGAEYCLASGQVDFLD
jgi:carbonic anhydrase